MMVKGDGTHGEPIANRADSVTGKIPSLSSVYISHLYFVHLLKEAYRTVMSFLATRSALRTSVRVWSCSSPEVVRQLPRLLFHTHFGGNSRRRDFIPSHALTHVIGPTFVREDLCVHACRQRPVP